MAGSFRGRLVSDWIAIGGMVVGACIGVFYAVDANFIMHFIIIALGLGIGQGRATKVFERNALRRALVPA